MRSPEDAPTDADQLIRFGSVASVDLAAARCTVKFDDDVESAPIRWIESRHGATSTWTPPSVGEQVVLLCPAGEIGAGVALRGLSCAAFPPADNRAIDLVKFGDDAVLSYDAAAHEMIINLPAGATITATADGGVTINGPVTINGETVINGQTTVNGDVQVNGQVDVSGNIGSGGTVNASTTVIGGGVNLKTHRHSGVTTGSGTTGTPT